MTKPASKTTNGSKPSVFKLLAEIASVIAIFAALIVSIGWSYAQNWFNHWKMPVASLGLSTADFLEYGRVIVSGNIWFLIPILALFSGAVCLLARAYSQQRRAIFSMAFILATAILWNAAQWIGETAASQDFLEHKSEGFQAFSMVELVFIDKSGMDPTFLQDTGGIRTCYRRIFSNENFLWVAKTTETTTDFIVAMVPINNLSLVRLYPTRGSCAPPWEK